MRTSVLLAVLGAASLGLADNWEPEVELEVKTETLTPTFKTTTTTRAQIAQNLPTLVDDSKDPSMKDQYACMNSQGTLSRSAPTQPAALSSWSRSLSLSQPLQTLNPPLNSPGGPEVYCTSAWLPLKSATPPSSLSAEYASWKSEWNSWRESASPAAHSLASSCKTVPLAETMAGLAMLLVATDAQDCATAMSVVYGGAAAQVTGDTKGGAAVGAATGTSSSSASGARETAGIVAGVLAVAGLIGGVAIL
ncbi:hypothetical protein QBC38DRAFT_481981 [Podospora fimiseda]|uniref:Infection structure specific protein n=1 Tax=Podospora fimiseda TaxID=252190 RepID=A0AAN7BLZ7_9PEZI|nr:hypothetical protein QBC38DRAFT_481981 [Podospora fimiseda]